MKSITADVTHDLQFSDFKNQSRFFDDPAVIKELSLRGIYNESELKEKISKISQAPSFDEAFSFLNIFYIAPYSFEAIERQCGSFDYISSQVVLEHVHPEILEILFQKTKQWLKTNGGCVHTINFIDHFANPGFFQDKSISEFNFLRFSDKDWNFWAGNPIAYTNRLAAPYYFELCRKYDLTAIDFVGENYREKVPLATDLIHQDVLAKYNSLSDISDITKYQRGTIVIKS